MALKKCPVCDRKFSKAEHFKRHERSHTREKPYECNICKKRYSRSDVLGRHVKGHLQKAAAAENAANNSAEQNGNVTKTGTFPIESVNSAQELSLPPVPEQHEDENGQIAPASFQPPMPNHHPPMRSASFHGHPADNMAMRSNRTVSAASLISPNAQTHLPTDIDGMRTEDPNFNSPGHGTLRTEGIRANDHHPLPLAPSDNHPPTVSSHPFQSQNQNPEQAPSAAMDHRISAANVAGLSQHPFPNGNFTDILQPWLFQTGSEGGSMPEHFDPMAVDAFFGFTADIGSSSAAFRNRLDSTSDWRGGCRLDENIPNERFARVQRCWLTPQPGVTRLITTVWSDSLFAGVDNIFSERSSDLVAEETTRQQGLRWGLDEQCRARLENQFSSSSRLPGNLPSWKGADEIAVRSPEGERASSQAGVSVSTKSQTALFPPAEILDMALDQYFRHFHPLVPFMHAPTFSAKNIPLPMLYLMCHIGLLIMGTAGATAFVLQEFSTTLRKVCEDLNASAMGARNSSSLLISLATGFLMLNVAVMTGQEENLEESQTLFLSLMSLAQRHGLFTPNEGPPPDSSQYDSISDVEQRWKAWARVESVKRLMTCLIMVDSWFSVLLQTSPSSRADAIQLVLPCEDILFSANSPQRWLHLAQHGRPIVMPSMVSSADGFSIPKPLGKIDAFPAYAIMSMVQLRICEGYHRLFCGRERLSIRHDPLVPHQAYATDVIARPAIGGVVEVLDTYGDLFERLNHNCMIMWHSMCTMLTADVRIFELAAGRAGAEPARAALDDITTWSQTPAARRACIHSAHIYKLMFNRKASDGTMFQSATALFAAALILGLYVFMVPPQDGSIMEMQPPTELFDEVDWKRLGNAGLTTDLEPQLSPDPMFDDDPAVRFIRNGGSISINGVPTQPGYQSARRVLLDFADLLKGIPRWNLRKCSRVLLIMSDVLMDVDNQMQD